MRTEDYADAASPRGILINYGQDYEYMEGNNVKKVAGDVLTLRAGDALAFTAGSPDEPVGETAQFTLGAVTDQRPMGVLTGSFSLVTLVVRRTSGTPFCMAIASRIKRSLPRTMGCAIPPT